MSTDDFAIARGHYLTVDLKWIAQRRERIAAVIIAGIRSHTFVTRQALAGYRFDRDEHAEKKNVQLFTAPHSLSSREVNLTARERTLVALTRTSNGWLAR